MAKLEGVKSVDMVGGEITKISYEGAEYVRVDGRSYKGDIILVKKAWGSQGEGEFYEDIAEEHPLYRRIGGVYFVHIIGEAGYARTEREDVEIFRKTSVQTTPTLAEVSDKVDAIEKRVGALEGEPKRLAIGDYAVITGKGDRGIFSSHRFPIDEVVKITEHSEGKADRVKAKNLDGSASWWVYNGYLRKATDEEIAEATAPKFEEGDYVRTLKRGEYFDIDAGKIVKITVIDEEGWGTYHIKAELSDGSDFDYFRPQDLERLEGEDVERIEQFAKAGRKLNEFKKGDVVSTEYYGIVEVTEIKPDLIHSVRGHFNGPNDGMMPEFCTLIAPVESRVDAE